jgi:hypothetical protein
MKIIFSAGILLLFICFGFTFKTGADYQVVPLNKVSIEKKFYPVSPKTGTFLYTEPKQLRSAFSNMSGSDMQTFDFEKYRYVHIQYAEQIGCDNQVNVIQEVRKYKHYYEIILVPYKNGVCKEKVKPYEVTAIPNDRLPVLITGTLPE